MFYGIIFRLDRELGNTLNYATDPFVRAACVCVYVYVCVCVYVCKVLFTMSKTSITNFYSYLIKSSVKHNPSHFKGCQILANSSLASYL